MGTQVARYLMNPAEDVVLFGDDLREGMWVLREDWLMRRKGSTEDEQLRAQRFMKVTRLRIMPGPHGDLAVFDGEYIDGYQVAQRVNVSFAWIVKKDSLPPVPGAEDGKEG